MKPFRSESVYISDKTKFYAHILAKAKTNGTQCDMTIDQLCDAELIDRWENQHPELVLAWEKNCELKQRNKKDYDKSETEILRLISPVPGAPKTSVESCEKNKT